MSWMFDTQYNNITSNQAPGLTEAEKSVFLTKAQDEIVKNYFLPQSNPKQAGYDDNQKRQADFSCLMKVQNCSSNPPSPAPGKIICLSGTNTMKEYPAGYFSFSYNDEPYTVNPGKYNINGYTSITVSSTVITVTPNLPFNTGDFILSSSDTTSLVKIDSRSSVYSFPADVFLAINESAVTSTGRILQVMPLSYDEYIRLMSKPYKRPVKNQAWRLINTGTNASGNAATKYVELIGGPNETIASYTIRYVRKPKPIIVGDLDGLTINGYYLDGGTVPSVAGTYLTTDGECELDPMLHEEILQRAVELAKVAWTNTGQENMQAVIQAGQRSE